MYAGIQRKISEGKTGEWLPFSSSDLVAIAPGCSPEIQSEPQAKRVCRFIGLRGCSD
jgi:hypothetical protein